MRRPIALLVAALACGWGPAHADPDEVFALIVTNNRSLSGQRPDLHYADDDGARYHAVFRTVAPPTRVILLTRFDAPSARLFPALAAAVKPPTRAEIVGAVQRLRSAVLEARARGRRAIVYFVFARHGDVERGKGYLELEDGRLGAEELEEQIVKPLAGGTLHLVIDSCNSFFVLNPRKPGGKRFATPRDLLAGFARRHPGVGVFLSTSAEGEVYEWSEIQSGIFSHLVRSGLSGAADADGDGRVSYDELAAFVTVASEGIKNEHYRPKVFARGPHGKGGAGLFSVSSAEGRRIILGKKQRRLWIRDADGTRLVDVHKEAGAELPLVIPAPGEAPLVVQEQRAAGGRLALEERLVRTSAEPVRLASLAAQGRRRLSGALLGALRFRGIRAGRGVAARRCGAGVRNLGAGRRPDAPLPAQHRRCLRARAALRRHPVQRVRARLPRARGRHAGRRERR
jgi:hypothetical protein